MANLCLLVFQLNSQRQLQGNYNHAIKKILDLDKRGSSSEIEMGYIRPLHDLLASILTCLANEMGTTSVSLIFKKEDEAIAWPFVSLDLDDIEENFSDAILEKEIQFKDCWLRYVFNSDAEKILECDNKNITDIFGVDQGILKDSIGDIPIAKCYGFTIPVIFKSEANGLKLKAAILLLSQTQKTKPPEFPDFYSQLIQKAFYNIALIREEFADIKHLEFILKIEKIAEEIGEWNSKFLRKVSDEIRTQFNLDGCLIYHAFNVNSILYPAAYSGVGQESKIMDAHYKFNSQRNQGEIGEAAISESTVYIPSPPKELTRHYHLPKLHKPSLFIVPIRYQEKLLAVISCLRFTTQFIEEDRVFSTPLSVPIFNKIALSLGRIFRNQMDQTVYKERQLYMEGLVKHLHELNGASSKDFLFIKLHEVVSKVLPLENQFFCIFTVNSEEERKSSKETKTLTVFSESRVALKQKLREQGKFFESFEFPKFVEDEGLTGRLLNPKNTSEPVEFHPMVEDAGKPECIRFWNAVGCR